MLMYLVEVDAFWVVESWDVVALAFYEPVVAEEDTWGFGQHMIDMGKGSSIV